MGPKCEREGIGQNVLTQTPDRHHSDTTPFALPFIGGVVLAVPCRVPQNYYILYLYIQYEAREANVTQANLGVLPRESTGRQGPGCHTKHTLAYQHC